MPYREINYSWDYNLKSTPEQLWPFVSDTNRFNRDTGVPSVEPTPGKRQRLRNARRRLQLSFYGFAVEWEEQPFEWVRPMRFGVSRKYSKGPVAELRALAELTPLDSGGTKLTYRVSMMPKNLFGALFVPLQIRFISARRFERAFRKYDEAASTPVLSRPVESVSELSAAAMSRIDNARTKLVAEGEDPEVVDRMLKFIQEGDDFSVSRIRPYELAEDWNLPRRDLLTVCLRATRAGVLDLQWDLMCPLCRGASETGTSLRDINAKVHCDACRIDFKANFDRFVELTFRPNALIRQVEHKTFCLGSPHKSPHIVAQQLLPARTQRNLTLPLEEGSYRLRALELDGEQRIKVSENGNASARITVAAVDWPNDELELATQSSIQLENSTDAEQLLILERTLWDDLAATAAQVTALQIFRDLFSTEALRPGEEISVGTLTVLFTDLRNSTRLYREIGDATAFGRVMSHFDVLKKEIADQDGALVKTIGDAVMAVFRSPASALRAMLNAQEALAMPRDGSMPLTLKAGLHSGPCIAVTLNDRLDYFGSTVNMAARLEGLSTGSDVIISDTVFSDAEVRALISPENELQAAPFEMELKGFTQESFKLWRVERGTGKAEASVVSR
jgi:class 3 adenylate cyclase